MSVIRCTLEDGIRLPLYMSPKAAGADLAAAETVVIDPGQTEIVSTGLRVAIPTGHVGLIASRSGLAKTGLVVANAPGVLDADFVGVVRILLFNRAQREMCVTRGERIAQLLVVPVVKAVFSPVESLDGTERGEGGFGSTGL